MSDRDDSAVDRQEELSEEEAEELLHDAAMNLDRVRNDYPALTGELDSVLSKARTGIALGYFRIGREDASPSLTELSEREVTLPWEGDNGE